MRVTIPVEGMHCSGCAGRLEEALHRVDGVTEAAVSFATELAHVDLEGTNPDPVLHAIGEAGFYARTQPVNLAVEGLTCATCAGTVERVLRAIPGVQSAAVNLATNQAMVAVTEGVVDPSALTRALTDAGYPAELALGDTGVDAAREAQRHQRERREGALLLGSLALTLPLMLPMVLAPFGVSLTLPGGLQLALAAPVQAIAGARFYRGAWRALRSGHPNMDVLVALGTTAAFGLSVGLWWGGASALYFESAAAVITFVRIGKWLEERVKRQTSEALSALRALVPEEARILRDGVEFLVPVATVSEGDLVVVRPGEALPVDGTIREGTSHLNESLISGESRPVLREPGEPVVGGTLNGEGRLLIQTTRTGSEGTIGRILRLVQDAQASKAFSHQLVDQISRWFVPAILVAAGITLVAWLLYGVSIELALIHAVSVLVIACPCALGLATPVALVAGTGAAARAGILIRDARALEQAHAVRTVVFDKTGTLTEGTPQVQAIESVDPSLDWLAHVATAQRGSEHPLAAAIIAAAKGTDDPMGPTQFTAIPGRGIRATVDDKIIEVGSPRWFDELGIDCAPLERSARAHEVKGATVVWAAADGMLLGMLVLADPLRATASSAVERLHEQGLRVVLLSGDNQAAANMVGQQLGMDHVMAEVLPEGKLQAIEQERAQRAVAMVGDGVNDAPALAAADVGVAMASGTDIAMHTAGITLMTSDPKRVADAIDISRRTMAVIRQNLGWAFIYNVVGIPLAMAGLLTPMFAGGAMALSSVSVVANAVRLRGWQPRS